MRNLLAFLLLLIATPLAAQTPLSQFQTFKTLQSQALNYTGPDALSVTRTRNAKNGDTISVRDFCAVADGSTDNTACIQAAVNAVCARSPQAGGTILFPQGAYAVSAASGVTIGCQSVYLRGVAGQGDPYATTQGGSLINVIGSGSATTFLFKSSSFRIPNRYASGGGVRDMTIHSANMSNSITQTGYAIDFEKCEGCLVDNVRLWGFQSGIHVYAGLQNRITQTQINQIMPAGQGILFNGSDAEAGCSGNVGNCIGRGDILYIDHVVLDAASPVSTAARPTCIAVQDFAATTLITNVICNQFAQGLAATCPTSTQIATCPAFITVHDLEVEASDAGSNNQNGANILLSDVQHFTCTGCQLFGYAVTNDVAVMNSRFSTSGDIQFIGGRIGYARQSCVVASVDQVYVGAGVNIAGCGGSGTGYYGVELRAPSVGSGKNSGTVQGVDFCRDAASNGSSSPNAMGAVSINLGGSSGSTGYNIVTGNRFRGCGSGVTGAGGTDVVSNNAGP